MPNLQRWVFSVGLQECAAAQSVHFSLQWSCSSNNVSEMSKLKQTTVISFFFNFTGKLVCARRNKENWWLPLPRQKIMVWSALMSLLETMIMLITMLSKARSKINKSRRFWIMQQNVFNNFEIFTLHRISLKWDYDSKK